MQPSISVRIAESLDPAEGMPLYHQLAAVVRWEVAQGRLPIGTMLPPVREVAAAAGINYHTVRRAWTELVAEGVIDQRRGRGARVVRAPQRGAWSPAGPATSGDAPARVWVVAGSLQSAATLAGALVGRWQLEAIPWPVNGTAPPPGVILCVAPTQVAARLAWPDREGDLRELPVVLAPTTLAVLRRNATLLGVSRIAIVAANEDPAALELSRQLPRLGLATVRLGETLAGGTLEEVNEALVLYFPADWQRLDWAARMHPRALAAELRWAAGPLAGVAREQGWTAATQPLVG